MNNIHRLSLLVLVLALTLIGYVSYILLYPYDLIQFNTKKYEILTPQVSRGGIVMYNIDIVKKTDIPCTRSRQLINGYSYAITPKIVNAPKGKVYMVASQQLPEYIETGTYHIRTTYIYKINPLREIVYAQDTEDFEVIK